MRSKKSRRVKKPTRVRRITRTRESLRVKPARVEIRACRQTCRVTRQSWTWGVAPGSLHHLRDDGGTADGQSSIVGRARRASPRLMFMTGGPTRWRHWSVARRSRRNHRARM